MKALTPDEITYVCRRSRAYQCAYNALMVHYFQLNDLRRARTPNKARIERKEKQVEKIMEALALHQKFLTIREQLRRERVHI